MLGLETTARVGAPAQPARSLIWAVLVGNMLEWYDFIVYGFLATTLATIFFPAGDPFTALLGSYAAFALSFVVRPFGGILVGYYADRAGRGAALVLVMTAMTMAMLIMTFTPTYASIGAWATVLLVVARLLQALSAGGEFASAATFLIEAAPPNRRGLYSGLYSAGPPLATIFSALIGLLVTTGMSPETREAWGWRVPFAVGLLIAPIGLYVRLRLQGATPMAEPATPRMGLSGFATFFRHRPGRLFVGLILASVTNSTSYVFLVYAPTYVLKTLKLPIAISFLGLIVSGITSSFLVPTMGALADRFGRFRLMQVGLILLVILIVPLYVWLSSAPSLGRFLVFSCLASTISSTYAAVYVGQMAELFEPGVRSTSMALCYNISSMLFGAFSLVLITWLSQATRSPLVPGFYVASIAALCGIASLSNRKMFLRNS